MTITPLVSLVALATILPAGVAAHPHIFVDTSLEVIFDDTGAVSALRIGWTYDDLTSLLIIEDRALDPDGDGILAPEAIAGLQGFDMQWEAGFAGDTYAQMGGQKLTLSAPSEFTASYAQGKLSSTHLRRFVPAVDIGQGPLVVQSYDPGFYSAYAVVGQPLLTGRADCTVAVIAPDTDAADTALLAQLAAVPADIDLEMQFPDVGASYADQVVVTCSAP
jgi:ABC-type uncharacterized transport system substrate-binding protein